MSWAWMPSNRNEIAPPRTVDVARAVDREAVAEAVARARRARSAVSCTLVRADRVHAERARGSRPRRRSRSPRRSAGCRPRTSTGTSLVVKPSMRDVADHLAAAEERRHRLEQLGAGPERADAGRAEHLVAGERRRSRRPTPARRPARCGTAWHASTSTSAPAACAASASGRMSLIVPSTFDIARDREQLGAVEQPVEVGEVEAVVGGERDPAQLDAALGGEDVPRHDVGVVLHLREHDRRRPRARLARAHVYATRLIASVALRREDDLVGAARVDEAGDLARGRASYAAVASSAIVYTPRWMLA